MSDSQGHRAEGRPYRSHLHPACFSCKKRKSRCRTQNASTICIMCQVHGTECIFPSPDSIHHCQGLASPRKSNVNLRRRAARGRHSQLSAREKAGPRHMHIAGLENNDTPQNEQESGALPSIVGMVAGAGDDNPHIVSPAVAEDNRFLENYLSALPTAQETCFSRSGPESDRSFRPVRFNLVPRRPLGVCASQTLAAAKCEVIEKYMGPNMEEYLDLFFQRANVCFPIFDEASFRSAYSLQRDKLSPALLCNLYANSLVYWQASSTLSTNHPPDMRFIWNQANEALHSELFLSPGISTVMSILINVCGRPSTSMFGNGGMVGTAVALANALGLHRDPSGWGISSLERSLRIRLWWLVLIHDRWCSLAYGTPLQVHRAQYDVPFPTADDLCAVETSPYGRSTASVFVAMTTLTDVLARYLEHIYAVSSSFPVVEQSALDLERMLNEWEEALSEDMRNLVLRGMHQDLPSAANFRLAYLAVKLLLRRIQLDLSRSSAGADDNNSSPFYIPAQRAAEDIAYFVQGLTEDQLCGFWIPVHAFSITSATMLLLRSGLRIRHQPHNMPLKIARDLIDALRVHRERYGWDLADHCLSHCSELVEKVGMHSEQTDDSLLAPDCADLPCNIDMDPATLEELFVGITGFPVEFDV
ncbi:Zn(II)2Cys6 transcription factor [Aspergillus brunneoviolaceus CBS 621.78]|uniref:Zn(II)2Cys6 transcription factor n=1 Tax=Aspergillus brunneoviolaceus CBS 621.78 TaxID=1450534 RepID=A0ACD1GMI6_9EURO|nr:putative Zn(II)2Cys6 transcription factor [Aspergillus brunneoviolaceus CBS 621.78]RAH50432.1 putative Zn(II)2Cys6 transcription factor [Aspergillus brunneoviolaceus CBS 621.78]